MVNSFLTAPRLLGTNDLEIERGVPQGANAYHQQVYGNAIFGAALIMSGMFLGPRDF